MGSLMAGLLRRTLREVWRGLQAAGTIWVAPECAPQPYRPPDDLRAPYGSTAWGVRAPYVPGALPGDRHPERVAAHVPPTERERELWRQLE
ncbi:DUF6059 family protein [Streptomyces coelicoflavus]|uniref:DUF6059 family protein n=1 Tax=Streptomyces coelicoflavus TaxID=285562 RepID=UPI00367EEE56